MATRRCSLLLCRGRDTPQGLQCGLLRRGSSSHSDSTVDGTAVPHRRCALRHLWQPQSRQRGLHRGLQASLPGHMSCTVSRVPAAPHGCLCAQISNAAFTGSTGKVSWSLVSHSLQGSLSSSWVLQCAACSPPICSTHSQGFAHAPRCLQALCQGNFTCLDVAQTAACSLLTCMCLVAVSPQAWPHS